jgi:hypothetical protein
VLIQIFRGLMVVYDYAVQKVKESEKDVSACIIQPSIRHKRDMKSVRLVNFPWYCTLVCTETRNPLHTRV